MSASKWAWTEACDNQPCVGDCDLCDNRVVVGWWIKRNISKVFSDKKYFECSECNHLNIERSDFCPHCGADMRKHNKWENKNERKSVL